MRPRRGCWRRGATAAADTAIPRTPSGRPLARVSSRTQREEENRHPLDGDREQPRAHRRLAALRDAESASAARINAPTQASLCPPPARCTARTRVPADERDRERLAAGQPPREQGGAERGCGGERLVRPRRNRVGVAGDDRERLGGDRERRPVDARRVDPVAAHERKRRIVRKVHRRVGVRVPAAAGPDPAVRPVRPGVRREQQRRGERNELDRRREDDDGAEARAALGGSAAAPTRRSRTPRSGERGRTGPSRRRCRRGGGRAASRAARRARRRRPRARGRPRPPRASAPHGCWRRRFRVAASRAGFSAGGVGVVFVAVVSVAVVSVVAGAT